MPFLKLVTQKFDIQNLLLKLADIAGIVAQIDHCVIKTRSFS